MGFNIFLGIKFYQKTGSSLPRFGSEKWLESRSQDVAVGLFADFLDGTRDLDEHLGPGGALKIPGKLAVVIGQWLDNPWKIEGKHHL